jgi:plasmid maintenance system antidote protein VapI
VRLAVTAQLALFFGKAFGQSPQYWLNLQAQFDLMKAERSIGSRLGSIKRIASPQGRDKNHPES